MSDQIALCLIAISAISILTGPGIYWHSVRASSKSSKDLQEFISTPREIVLHIKGVWKPAIDVPKDKTSVLAQKRQHSDGSIYWIYSLIYWNSDFELWNVPHGTLDFDSSDLYMEIPEPEENHG